MRFDCFRMNLSWLALLSAALFCGACKERGRAPTAPPQRPVLDKATTGGDSNRASPIVATPATTTKVDAKPPASTKPFDRKTLERAYLEIACIQKKGEAQKLLAAYKKYGFGDPKAWIKAWESQKGTDDYEQWLAGLTQRAWKACPQ